MTINNLTTVQGVHIPFEFFISLGCDAVMKMVENSENITATYQSLLLQIDNTGSSLWNRAQDGGCFEGLCQNIFGSGNTDITGVGVVTAYAMEFFSAAFLSTILLICWRRTGEREISHAHGKTKALIASMNIFIDSSLFFALATVLATCPLMTHLDDVPQYDAVQSLLSSTITIAPCLAPLFALQCLGEKVGRRLSILGLACFISIAFANIPNVVWVQRNQDPVGSFGFPNRQLNTLAGMNGRTEIYGNRTAAEGGTRIGNYFWEACYELGSETGKPLLLKMADCIFPHPLICQVLLLGLITLFGVNMAKLRFNKLIRNIRRFQPTRSWRFSAIELEEHAERRTLQRRNGYLPNWLEIFAFMILPLALGASSSCTLLGQRFMLTREWGVKDETEWGFGQMVALLMFLPVIIEFPYRWLSNRPRLRGAYDPSDMEKGKPSDTEDFCKPFAHRAAVAHAGEVGVAITTAGAQQQRGSSDRGTGVGRYRYIRPHEISYPGPVLMPVAPAAATVSPEFLHTGARGCRWKV